ncbi:MAG: S-methyl-5'-thioadenosine phosphorylase [Desulforhopalus sp.]|nr:S-methyl-5'-thioadenosine phosphorylase [Desulforhopalus sp.]
MDKIGIIGGSGLDDPSLLANFEEIEVSTEYGAPSSPLTCGSIDGVQVVLLARHGRRHQYSPTQVNNRANLKALQEAGVSVILATTACGSLREDVARGDLVILDQFIDFTRFRKNSFVDSFEEGMQHPAMAHPFNAGLRQKLYRAAQDLGLKTHPRGCVITIEGPRFSTVAESRMYRIWGADLVNMSTAPEAALANELKIPYACVAMSTDYDSWKEEEVVVSWEDILEVFNNNAHNIKNLLVRTVKEIGLSGGV